MIDGNYAVRMSSHILHSLVQVPSLLPPKNGDGGDTKGSRSAVLRPVGDREYLSIH